MMKCIIFADDTNFLYTGDDISEICKTVSAELDEPSEQAGLWAAKGKY